MIGRTIGGYRILNRLGRGGMGTVYQAQAPDGDIVAVKVLAETFTYNETVIRRFHKENKLIAEMDHPRIVRALTGIEEAENRYFFVMEYIAGRDLRHLIRDDGPIPIPQALAIIDGILEALEFAHLKGVIHRDIKPSNVLLDVGGRTKLSDFGLARASGDSKLTVTGAILGTPEYMAPEQADGGDPGPPADLYSTGIILYELLSGSPPFTSDTPLALLRMHCDVEPPPLPDTIPTDIRVLVENVLSKDPKNRFESANEMRHAVRALEAFDSSAVSPLPDITDDPTAPGVAEFIEFFNFDLPPTPQGKWFSRIAMGIALVVIAGGIYVASSGPRVPPPPVPVSPFRGTKPPIRVYLRNGQEVKALLLGFDVDARNLVIETSQHSVKTIRLTDVIGLEYEPKEAGDGA